MSGSKVGNFLFPAFVDLNGPQNDRDPFKLEWGVDPNDAGNVQSVALIPVRHFQALATERARRRLKPTVEGSARLLAELVVERLEELTGKVIMARTPEAPSTRNLRHWMAEQAIGPQPEPLPAKEISTGAGMHPATAALALRSLEGCGFAEKINGTCNGRPAWVWRLTAKGLAQSNLDHPDLAVRSLIMDRIEGVS